MPNITQAHAALRREALMTITRFDGDAFEEGATPVETRTIAWGDWPVRANIQMRRILGVTIAELLPDQIRRGRAFGGDSILVTWWLSGFTDETITEDLEKLLVDYPTDGVITKNFSIDLEVAELDPGDIREVSEDPPIPGSGSS